VSCTGKPDGKRTTRRIGVSCRPTGIGLNSRTGSQRWTAQLAPLRTPRSSSLIVWHVFWLHTGSRFPQRRSRAHSSLQFRIRKARPSPSRPKFCQSATEQIQVSLTRHRECERSIWHDRICPRKSEPMGKRHRGSRTARPHQRGKRAWGLAAGKGIAHGFCSRSRELISKSFPEIRSVGRIGAERDGARRGPGRRNPPLQQSLLRPFAKIPPMGPRCRPSRSRCVLRSTRAGRSPTPLDGARLATRLDIHGRRG
jgi:hypothetical protein